MHIKSDFRGIGEGLCIGLLNCQRKICAFLKTKTSEIISLNLWFDAFIIINVFKVVKYMQALISHLYCGVNGSESVLIINVYLLETIEEWMVGLSVTHEVDKRTIKRERVI